MKKIFKYSVAAIASISLFAACSLELKPAQSIAYTEGDQLIQTEANLTSFENGILASFRSLQRGEYWMAEDIQLDAFNAVADYGNNYGDLHRGDQDFNANQYEVEDFWANNYTAIKNYNILIAATGNVPAAIAAKAKVVKGEAFFFRAASYLQLARHFGKAYGANAATDLCVPCVLVYNQAEMPARATVKAIYDQVKQDLDSASVLLAGQKGAVRSQKPTIDAVNALKARYFLDIKDYTNAAATAAKLIADSTYTLAGTQAEFTAEFTNDTGNEPIMQMFASLSEAPNAINYYTILTKNADYGTVYRPYFIPSKKLATAYDTSDFRSKNWFDNCDNYPIFVQGAVYDGVKIFTKYLGNPALTTALQNGRNAAKPFTIAEMYLIAAEAYSQSGKNLEAKLYLNALQEARGAKTTDGSFNSVKKEWFRETVGDGLRLSCLKRWGEGFETRAAQDAAAELKIIMTGTYYDQKTLAATDFHLCWPVPTYELKVNKNLVQNEGYGN